MAEVRTSPCCPVCMPEAWEEKSQTDKWKKALEEYNIHCARCKDWFLATSDSQTFQSFDAEHPFA